MKDYAARNAPVIGTRLPWNPGKTAQDVPSAPLSAGTDQARPSGSFPGHESCRKIKINGF